MKVGDVTQTLDLALQASGHGHEYTTYQFRPLSSSMKSTPPALIAATILAIVARCGITSPSSSLGNRSCVDRASTLGCLSLNKFA
jgi:hypothetical protein